MLKQLKPGRMKRKRRNRMKSKGVALSLPAEINIANNPVLREKLEKILQKGYEKTVLDIRKVKKTDLSSLQILMAFVKHAFDTGMAVEFAGPLTESFSGILEAGGFMRKTETGDIFIFHFLDGKGVRLGYR